MHSVTHTRKASISLAVSAISKKISCHDLACLDSYSSYILIYCAIFLLFVSYLLYTINAWINFYLFFVSLFV